MSTPAVSGPALRDAPWTVRPRGWPQPAEQLQHWKKRPRQRSLFDRLQNDEAAN
jgi:hypothetical protein